MLQKGVISNVNLHLICILLVIFYRKLNFNLLFVAKFNVILRSSNNMPDGTNMETTIPTTVSEWKVAEPYQTEYLQRIAPITQEQALEIVGKETEQKVPDLIMKYLQANNQGEKIKYSTRIDGAGQLAIVGELTLSGNNKLFLVLEPNFDKSDAYKNFLVRKAEGKLTPDKKMLGFLGGQKTSNAIRARNVIVTDEASHTAIDLGTIFPEVPFRFAPGEKFGNSEYDDGEHSTEKLLTTGNITELDSPILGVMTKLHEMGHCAMQIQTPSDRYTEMSLLAEEAKAVNGPKKMTPEKYTKLKELLSENEVGAWMHALLIKHMLEKQGVSIGLTDDEVVKFANEKLDTYEKGFGGENKLFQITEDKLQNLPA